MSELDVLKAKVEELAAKVGGDVHVLWDEFLAFIENKKNSEAEAVPTVPTVTTIAGIETTTETTV